jgi:hypothetical protein
MTENLIYHILIYINILSLIVGYILGKIFTINMSSEPTYSVKNNSSKSLEKKVAAISIDDKKYVVAIDTKGIEKKFDTISTTKKSEENISDAVNKLKNMKG